MKPTKAAFYQDVRVRTPFLRDLGVDTICTGTSTPDEKHSQGVDIFNPLACKDRYSRKRPLLSPVVPIVIIDFHIVVFAIRSTNSSCQARRDAAFPTPISRYVDVSQT